MKTHSLSSGAGAVAGAALLFAASAESQEVIQLPAGDQRLEPELVDLYRIGSLAGEDWEQFGNIRNVAFDGAGRLHVFDRQAAQIFVVDRSGGLHRRLGGRGEGPGEFRNAHWFAVTPGGKVVVADQADRAYEIFDANGDYERRVRMGEGLEVMVLWSFMPDPVGDAVFSAVGSQMLSFSFVANAPSPTTRPIERHDLSGDVVIRDTVADGWLPPDGELYNGLREPFAFGPRMSAGMLPDGSVAFSDSTAYVIRIARPGAGVVRVLTRPLQPVAVTGRMMEAEKDRRRERLQGLDPGLREFELRHLANLRFPEEFPNRPRTGDQLGRGNLGAAPRRGTDRPLRSDRCAHDGRTLRRHLCCGCDRDAGRVRPRWSGCVYRDGRVGCEDGGREKACTAGKIVGHNPDSPVWTGSESNVRFPLWKDEFTFW